MLTLLRNEFYYFHLVNKEWIFFGNAIKNHNELLGQKLSQKLSQLKFHMSVCGVRFKLPRVVSVLDTFTKTLPLTKVVSTLVSSFVLNRWQNYSAKKKKSLYFIEQQLLNWLRISWWDYIFKVNLRETNKK
jgi:hypothetical protein